MDIYDIFVGVVLIVFVGCMSMNWIFLIGDMCRRREKD